ncbi:MAG: UDP-N-acetylmuramate--L-alanine ligase [Candidatus Palauibacterales bacterium]|nr:UDP-N-acetylmuramate--L-alanine ligase [Candidatus Palauibacterales bacterium]MDP2530796.1 UDP-N-acetylmuramate--L-alanine ligase [Candidatus Palauibacterales bacterium]MDP2583130.1 UDP-N-acetylmuramate--L-alanine ligase [Candidatus Palauibacterales bacterium]
MSAEAAVQAFDGWGREARGSGRSWAPHRLPRSADLPAPGSEVHLMGAAGAGMRALAVLLAGAGYRVSGCDRSGGPVEEMTGTGGRLDDGHDATHAEGPALLVRSSAVPEDHPEVLAARRLGVPVWRRARALAALVNDRTLAAVSGTHGKTTITAMTALAAEAAGLDPAAAVGGRLPTWGSHARSGGGRVAIVEADEFDRSFLELDPDLAVVSAVEEEHLESYGSVEALEAAYRTFAGRASSRLGVLWCADEPGARALGAALRGTASYGFAAGADYRVEPVGGEPEDGGAAPRRARLHAPEGEVPFRLGAPGAHNLQNAGAALAAALRLGADAADLEDALSEFTGVARRLQRLAASDRVLVVDDYAHHPTEVAASLAAARHLAPGARLVAVFQPHLYTRTRRFAAEFAAALAGGADLAFVLPVYGAREVPIEGVDASLVLRAASVAPVTDAAPVEETSAEEVLDLVRAAAAGQSPRTLFLFMGAGDITELAHACAGAVSGRDVP